MGKWVEEYVAKHLQRKRKNRVEVGLPWPEGPRDRMWFKVYTALAWLYLVVAVVGTGCTLVAGWGTLGWWEVGYTVLLWFVLVPVGVYATLITIGAVLFPLGALVWHLAFRD